MKYIQINTRKNSTGKTYRNIIFLIFSSHIAFTILFLILPFYPFAIYNGFSCIFYICILSLIKAEHYRAAITLTHAEICLFVIAATIFSGWNSGFSLFLISLSTLVYFCPYKSTYVPYLFSIGEFLIFFTLKLYSLSHPPLIPILSPGWSTFFYCFNGLLSFTIILYAAFISKISTSFTEKKLRDENEVLQEIADHDTLTHLWSRNYMQNKFCLEQKNCRRTILVMCDIDNFKKINDTYGHLCGDYVLARLATIMQELCPPNSDICRWGGEEFVILFYEITRKEAYEITEKLREYIASHIFNYNQIALNLTMTFGISSTDEKSDLEGLTRLADARLYQGKENGKNCVICAENFQKFKRR